MACQRQARADTKIAAEARSTTARRKADEKAARDAATVTERAHCCASTMRLRASDPRSAPTTGQPGRGHFVPR